MKISPVAQGTGTPAGAAATDRMPQDRLAAAKRIASGQVVEQEAPVDRQVERIQNVRRIKMKTNVSPETNYVETEAQAIEASPSGNLDATEQAPVTEETKPLSPQFAALAKQKRAIQTERAALDAERQAFESERAGLTQSSDLRARLTSNPLKTLLDEGVTYDQLTEQLLAGQSGLSPEVQELRAEIKALKEGLDTKFTERDTQAETQVLAEMGREADALIAEGEEFELVRTTGNKNQAMNLIKRVWKEEGKVLDVSEALTLVEEELLKTLTPVAESKKIQTRLTPQQTQTVAPQRQMRTLTARDGASMPLTAKQRAIAAFNGTLRK